MKKLIISLLFLCLIPTIAFGLTYTVDYKATGTEYKSLRYIVALATTNSKKCTIYLPHNSNSDQTTYTLANVDCNIPDYVSLDVANGAKLNLTGSGNVYIYKMGNIGNSQYLIDLDSTGRVYFREGSIKEVYSEWWDAPGDDAAKDTDAIQYAINSVSYIPISLMPGKEYLIAPTVSGTDPIFTVKSGTKIICNGATLKVANSAGNYYAIFLGSKVGTELSDVEISGGIFDLNTQNNPIPGIVIFETARRSIFFTISDTGSNLEFSHNVVKNANTMNDVFIGGDDLKKVRVSDNSFENTMVDTNSIYHDHSTIYLNTMDATVQNNFLEAADWNSNAVCAIEIHSSNSVVTGNIIKKYEIGMNITGISSVDNEQYIISDNLITNNVAGIFLWSQAVGAHTTGYGLSNAIISDNSIKIMQVSHSQSQDETLFGINFTYVNDLPCRSINMQNNLVEFEKELIAGDSELAYSAGICAITADPNRAMENVIVKNNTILNSPAAGIWLMGTLKNSEITGNTIINAGQGLNNSVNNFNCAIVVTPTPVQGVMSIKQNTIIDDFDTTRMIYPFYIKGDSGNNIEFSNNSVNIIGATKTAYLKSYYSDANASYPFIDNDRHNYWIQPTFNCKTGSNVMDTSTGNGYRLTLTGTNWIKSGNVIINGDNESALMSGITAMKGSLSQSSDQKYAGSYSTKYICDPNNTNHYIYTLTDIGNLYKTSAYVYLPSGQTTTALTLSTLLGPANQDIATTSLTDQWVLLTGYIVSTSAAIGIIGNATNCSGDYWYIDNYRIEGAL